MRTFEYSYVTLAEGSIDIEDIGNCVIRATSKFGSIKYLMIKTVMGFTNILEYGPIIPDIEEFPSSVICNYTRIAFKEKTVSKIINSFLRNPDIAEVDISSLEEAYQDYRDPMKYMVEKVI